jgi:hypothetical protein
MPAVERFVARLVVPMALGAWFLAMSPVSFAHPPKTFPKPGVVIVVSGVGGLDFAGLAAQWSLPRAGVRHEIREFLWTHGKGHYFRDLQDTRNCLQKADELAQEVRRLKAADPERPIFLIGKSGGSGLVLAAAEQLPRGTVERIILLSAAVSASYDIRPALRATKFELVSFYSPLDRVVLDWGTRNFGTIDRYYGPSAGFRGFMVPRNPTEEDQQLYNRLVQLPWNPKMILEGHTGGHLGTSMPAFMSKEVAPWLKP